MPAKIVVLGPPDVENPEPLLLGPRLSRLLALLVASRHSPVRTTVLVERLWPDVAPGSGDAALRVQLTRLRRLLGSQASIACRPGRGYQLNLGGDGSVQLDIDAFRSLAGRADEATERADISSAADYYRQALGQWRGTAFEGCEDDDAARVEQAELEALRRHTRRGLAKCVLYHNRRPDGSEMAEVARLAAEQPDDEALALAVIESMERSGHRDEAKRLASQTEQYLLSELGVTPSPQFQTAVGQLIGHPDVRSA